MKMVLHRSNMTNQQHRDILIRFFPEPSMRTIYQPGTILRIPRERAFQIAEEKNIAAWIKTTPPRHQKHDNDRNGIMMNTVHQSTAPTLKIDHPAHNGRQG